MKKLLLAMLLLIAIFPSIVTFFSKLLDKWVYTSYSRIAALPPMPAAGVVILALGMVGIVCHLLLLMWSKRIGERLLEETAHRMIEMLKARSHHSGSIDLGTVSFVAGELHEGSGAGLPEESSGSDLWDGPIYRTRRRELSRVGEAAIRLRDFQPACHAHAGG